MGCAATPPPRPMVDEHGFFQGRFARYGIVTLKILEKKSLTIKDINK
jgi:hypothetical protein